MSVAAAELPVSVVVPAFNRADLLPRALAGVNRQEPWRPAEVIVVDDCSTDGTAEVAEQLGARVLRHDENRGAAAARNTGIAAATHPWVALLDSDDEWLPHHLETLWPAREGRVLVTGGALVAGDDPRDLRYHGPLGDRPTVLASPAAVAFQENFIAASATLVRADAVIAAGGYDTSLRYAEDFDLWIRLLEGGTGVGIPEVVYLWHRHAGQKSRHPHAPRQAHRQIVLSYDGRPWWRRELADRRLAVPEWDDLRQAIDRRDWGGAARSARWLVARPARLRGLAGLLSRRRRVRRRTARIVGAVGPLPLRPADLSVLRKRR